MSNEDKCSAVFKVQSENLEEFKHILFWRIFFNIFDNIISTFLKIFTKF
jgi:hypothetical protein